MCFHVSGWNYFFWLLQGEHEGSFGTKNAISTDDWLEMKCRGVEFFLFGACISPAEYECYGVGVATTLQA